ncbi:hypothetical protein M409DRAFT_21869 [Zasmidium cellare ATCC 36951]|uniref:Pentacotripeptide-repeat region of PRORP domain-containing protein n=1 Tax=Zasmidium cellare ATCC 36951 TaxID=1080233 RepID=A0A6A6CKE7_ZASCE|nr:uncharacterized protein M409DRAFT_21869 [Zasmidium cellare ATCC 36951]KAF2167717.1 hypothetical protein M409DRAFT_21869 [Zasmidium cellare ATCC 36951]
MLECRACVQRCIRALTGDEVLLRRPLLLTPHLANQQRRRRVATAAPIRIDESQDALSSHFGKPNSKSPNKLSVATTPRGSDDKALKKELEWLKDPVKLADHVHYTLRDKNVEKAINLCRLASKSMSCIVAWNNVIDWHVKNQKVNAAIDIYNEMKKRGQFPDSYTYMLLFRAVPIEKSHELKDFHGQMANKAVAIYNSMSSPTSRVKPSIMHTNAVLRLCSLARNMDLLWSVASQIPESGPGSADHITYNILLAAIRYGAMGPGTGELVYVEQVAENRNQAVNEGRRIWQEVIPRWRSGEVIIDAALVRSMAKLLTFSKRMEDWDDVLNLVQQTTNIQRLIPPLGSPERNTDHVPLPADGEQDVEEQTSNSEDSEGWVPTPASNAFKPVQLSAGERTDGKKRHNIAYVKPENGILNVLLEACTNMRVPKAAHAYWDLFTREHDVHPDLDNYECLLRLLRINRSSRRVSQLMTEMKDEGIKPTPRTYRIAMGACARDRNNANVVENMTIIVDQMMKATKQPDLYTLDEYLNIAFLTDDQPAITKALDKAHAVMHRLQRQLLSKGPEVPQGYKERIVQFYRHMTGCVDTFSKRKDVPKEEREKWLERRSEYDSLTSEYWKQGRTSKREDVRAVSSDDAQMRSRRPRRNASDGPGLQKQKRAGGGSDSYKEVREQKRDVKMEKRRMRRA